MSEAASPSAPDRPQYVRAAREGRLGRITLDRQRAINALSLEMIEDVARALDGWEHDERVTAVLIDGEGERGLCAGGDVRSLYDNIVAGQFDAVVRYFRTEYALNARIAEYPKPVIVFADGITMGGGVGLAGHAAVRIVTERSRLAMPETRIGFTPDVGGTWLLARAPGHLGEYLGMTGGTMDAADAIVAGFADHLVAAADLPRLRERLAADADAIEEAIAAVAVEPGPSALAARRAWVDEAFSADSALGIVARLRARPEPEAGAVADELERLSPTGVTVTLAAVRSARTLPELRAALAQEYGLVLWFAATQPDLVEGIRAQLVDKDRSPRWRPAALADVPADLGARALAFVPDIPLWA